MSGKVLNSTRAAALAVLTASGLVVATALAQSSSEPGEETAWYDGLPKSLQDRMRELGTTRETFTL